ncbi:phage minor capsid protein [Paenibacillus tianjinensis]|uniref:Minor capsid protein n=1 Tax=Paenibacillus tianjinensis TaxID=2810347 RepID=A0ABX7L4N0_9BACL|nr:phage minor capsid protein [Paenibacillus tianjinensis]QSF42669.1 minor capsid protein [Paenibacillus tianjinensis]
MATAEELIALYVQTDQRLRDLVQALQDGNISNRRKQQLLQQVDMIIAELINDAGQGLAVLIGEEYRNGATTAVEQLIAAGIAREALDVTVQAIVHQGAAQAISDEGFYSILEASEHMSRDSKQRIEDAVRIANEQSLLEGVSRRQATQNAVAAVNKQGITGMIAKNGSRIPADKYMAGVVQYHQRKAHVTGVENMAVQNKQDLVYINSVGITCPICAVYQGRVYSISGNDSRFPRLERRPPYHSHCVHSMSVWVEEYTPTAEIEQTIKDSNRPFKDNRTEANMRRYDELQREKSRKNETRKQWIRYKAVLPNDTPDLKQFASNKVRGTAKYGELQELYRKVNIEIKRAGEPSG